MGVCKPHVPEKSSLPPAESSLPVGLVPIRVLNRVPMGSRGWPTQPSGLVVEVTPLCNKSVNGNTHSLRWGVGSYCLTDRGHRVSSGGVKRVMIDLLDNKEELHCVLFIYMTLLHKHPHYHSSLIHPNR